MKSLDDYDFRGSRVLLRLDINSPLDRTTKKIADTERITRSADTLNYLIQAGAGIAVIAHQGDTLDYDNLTSMEEHAEILSSLLGRKVAYIDDVCGPAALAAIKELRGGEVILLGNLRYLCEEVSSFEKQVRLTPQEMARTWLVRTLAPLFNVYVNEAFSAAHRSCPSQVAFQTLLPAMAGRVFHEEYEKLDWLLREAPPPSVFVLGGAKISDAFGMMERVLGDGMAHKILTGGVTGQVFLLAAGYRLGDASEGWIRERSLWDFVGLAKNLLSHHGDRILYPLDLACEIEGKRTIFTRRELPAQDALFLDIGDRTIQAYAGEIEKAGTLFVNGPPGVYDHPLFAGGTRALWQAIAGASGYSVLGGGDSIRAMKYFGVRGIDFVCTAGGAMIRMMSGDTLPLIEAMKSGT